MKINEEEQAENIRSEHDALFKIDTQKNKQETDPDALIKSKCGKEFKERSLKMHQTLSVCGGGKVVDSPQSRLIEQILLDFHQNQVSVENYDPMLLEQCRENIFLFNCCFCEMHFISRSEFESHNFQKHISEYQRWMCPTEGCSFMDVSMIKVLDHFANEQNATIKTVHNNHGTRLKYCPECDQAFFYIKHLKHHLLQAHDIKKGDHTCLMCYQEFDSKRRTWFHMRRVHDNSQYICFEMKKPTSHRNCYERFSTRKLYQDHVKENHNKHEDIPKRVCQVCGMEFAKANGASYFSHIETHDELVDLRYKCSRCQKGFSFEKRLLRHQRTCLPNQDNAAQWKKITMKGPKDCLLFHCCLCCHNFRTKEEQLEHDRENHLKNDHFTCPDCDFSSQKKMDVLEHFAEKHRREQTNGLGGATYGLKLVKCRECDQAFFSDRLLRAHLNQAHSYKLTSKECLICFKVFPTQNQAVTHMTNEHIGSQFVCCRGGGGRGKGLPKCGQLFDTQEELDDHIDQKHQVLDQYTCDVCGMTFGSPLRAKFNRHVESHSMGEPVFKCDQCDKSFFFETELNTHKKARHTIHKCDHCEYKSTAPQAVKHHMEAKHTDPNLKPHVCSSCGKAFKLKMFLTRHMEVHDPLGKNECKVCGKTFKAKRHLSIHSKIHSKSYEGQCNICDRKFVQKYNMKLHMRKLHPEMSDKK